MAEVPGTGPRLMVTPEPAATPPRVRIDLAGFAAGASVHVSRVDPDGRTRGVRQAEPVVVTASGGQVVYDSELPHNRLVAYTTRGAARVLTELPCGDAWAIAPGDPGASVRLGEIRTRRASSWASGTQLVRVLNRSAPVPVTNVARLSATSGMVVRTDTEQDAEQLLGLFEAHAVVLLQLPRIHGTPALWAYVAPGDLTMDYVSNGSVPDRWWSFDWTVTDRPEGSAKAQLTVGVVRRMFDRVADTHVWATVRDARTDVRSPT